MGEQMIPTLSPKRFVTGWTWMMQREAAMGVLSEVYHHFYLAMGGILYGGEMNPGRLRERIEKLEQELYLLEKHRPRWMTRAVEKALRQEWLGEAGGEGTA